MKLFVRALCAVALVSSPFALPVKAQESAPAAFPESLQIGEETPWIYRDSDVPQDKEWLFGELDNGLRYAVRNNGVPPGQASIRIRIDAGSLHERDSELGYAHLLEHLLFRESQYLGPGEAIPTWQRLGASFGSDTNAETSATHTAYKLDLPAITLGKLDESFKLLSGMVRAPVLSQANVDAEVPIVMAEKRERGGAAKRVADLTRSTLFAGQRLAVRNPIGTDETLSAATGESVAAFYKRWYRPENTVIAVAGDADAVEFARLIEKWFGDWEAEGAPVPAPDFGDPVAPAGADPDNPVGELAVVVESDMPRSLTYAVMRPWRQVKDTIVYNEGLLLDAIAQAIINRRLEARARGGGSYLYAQVEQDDVSRSTDATFVALAPLSEDWEAALTDVRGVIADAIQAPPTQEEIDREVAEFDIAFASEVEQSTLQAGSKLADQIVQAVDIRETVASPETVLQVFRNMRARLTPDEVLKHTRKLFEGDVVRGVLVTPDSAEASEQALRVAMTRDVAPDSSSRLAAQSISFDELPAIGEPGTVLSQDPLGLLDINRVQFDNGVRALLWENKSEPGRITVKVRFGAGYRAFAPEDAAYVALGEMALVGSGLGELGQEELDRLATGRKMGFDFAIEDAVFTFSAQTRSADLADQLYLFAAKLGMPRWDENPVLRAKAAAKLSYDTFSTSPFGVLNRDLEYLITDKDPRFVTPGPAMIEQATPAGFREVWEPLLSQGPVEVLVFGDFDEAATLEALRRTFGALSPRVAIDPHVAIKVPAFPEPKQETTVLTHRGDANQAAVVIAWPTGGGVERLRESRQIEILAQLFNNRLLDAMRERAGASYAPQVISDWPVDMNGGGKIMALAQLQPKDVPTFFVEANRIAQDLANTPAGADELSRVTEPLRQYISRASSGQNFWLFHLQGASFDARRVAAMPTLMGDYSRTTPEIMQTLAQRYLAARPGFKLAIIPEGQALAEGKAENMPSNQASGYTPPVITGR